MTASPRPRWISSCAARPSSRPTTARSSTKCSPRSSPTWCTSSPAAERERLVTEYHSTNYSVVDLDLIERIYGIFYRQKVSGIARHAFRTLTAVESAEAAGPLGIEPLALP
jgi:lysine/ornithine N-monooxygenase